MARQRSLAAQQSCPLARRAALPRATRPSAGRVLRVLQASEGAVALGTPLMEVGDTQRMEVVTELLTTDALAAKVGSRVVIEIGRAHV